MPNIAADIPPVLNVVKTRPKRCPGVSSWRIAHTTGVTDAILPPMIMINGSASTALPDNFNPQTAKPPTPIEAAITRNWFPTSR